MQPFFSHLFSTRSRAWSSMVSMISPRVGLTFPGKKHQGLPKLARQIIKPSREVADDRYQAAEWFQSFLVISVICHLSSVVFFIPSS